MVEIINFRTEFVERTRHILLNYRGEYILSNTINCTLGLLFLPNENLDEIGGTIWETSIAEIPELNFLNIRMFEPIHYLKDHQPKYYPKILRVLLKKIRDGFAHQHIEPNNIDGRFIRFTLRNFHPKRNGTLDMEIEFTGEDLRRFSLFIADKYLEMSK
jgi:hypothetical protein